MATIGGSLWHKYKMYAFLLVRAATTSLQFVLYKRRISKPSVLLEKWNLDITKGWGTEKISSIHWGFIISRFFSIYFTITGAKNTVIQRTLFYRGSTVCMLAYIQINTLGVNFVLSVSSSLLNKVTKMALPIKLLFFQQSGIILWCQHSQCQNF